MKVLVITGDKKFAPGHPRYDIQRSVVDSLEVVYWGRGATFPRIPEHSFDVVTSQDPFWRGLVALGVARKRGAKLNIQIHTDLGAQSWWRNMLARHTLTRADSIRVVSENIKKQVETLGVNGNISVLPVFTDIAPFRALIPVPHKQKTILWVGRFEQEKDPLYAVEVLRAARAHSDARMIMLGSGTLHKKLQDTASGLPVEFPGWHSPEKFLSQADVALSTSRHESYGVSIIEALAAGVPVVAPDVGVAREAGAIVVPREKLADAVIDVLTSPRRGELKLSLMNKEEWAEAFRQSLA
jgi:glycosyltransferase involved in cell wall biosynthesis